MGIDDTNAGYNGNNFSDKLKIVVDLIDDSY